MKVLFNVITDCELQTNVKFFAVVFKSLNLA